MTQSTASANEALRLRTFPVLVNSGPAARAKSTLTGVYELVTSFSDNVPQILSYSDPDLTPQAQAQFRDDLMAAHRATLGSHFKTLRSHLDEAEYEAAVAAAPYKPVLNPDDDKQLARTDQAWNNVIRPQLDTGKSYEEITRGADHDGLLAIQRFAPPLIAGSTPTARQHLVPDILANLKDLADQRVIDSATGEAKVALDEEVATRSHAAAARNGMNAMEQALPRDVVRATIGVKRATWAADAVPPRK